MVSMGVPGYVGQKEVHFITTHVSNEVILQLALQKLVPWSSQMRPEGDQAERDRKSGNEIFTMK